MMPPQPAIGAVSSGALIGVFIVLVIGLAVTPVILNFVNSDSFQGCDNVVTGDITPCGVDPVNETARMTSSQLAMVNLIPLFWVIGILVSTVLAVLIISRGRDGGV